MPGMMKRKEQRGRTTDAAGMRKRGRLGIASSQGQHGRFLHDAVLPMRELAFSLWPARDRRSGAIVRGKRLDKSIREELLARLRRVGAEPARPVAWCDAMLLLKTSERILGAVRSRGDVREVRQLAEAVAELRNALSVKRRRGFFGRLSDRGGGRSGQDMAQPMALGQAARAVVAAASVVIQFVNCHGMKVSVTSHGEQTHVVVDGGAPPEDGDDPSGPKERLRKISGVSCPYVIDEKENTIRHKSNGHDGCPSKTYRIPLGAASKAVNALVKGMVDGIRTGSEDWSAPFSSADAKALGRETNLDNRAFLKECVERTPLRGKGNQQYANSARLRR